MNLRPTCIGFGLIVGGVLAFSTTPARAASLFSFGTDFSYPGTGTVNSCTSMTQCDIALEKITAGNESWQLDDLFRVTETALLSNTEGLIASDGTGSAGGISLDRGDFATGVTRESLPAESDVSRRGQFNTSRVERMIVETLGNHTQSVFNLNDIIDTEDDGVEGTSDEGSVFTMDLLFNQGTSFNSVFLWERGMNSDIEIQPIYEVVDNQTATVGDAVKISGNQWDDAGYSIDTTEINLAQNVGSKGIHFESTIKGVRVIGKKQFDGADFKIVAGTKTAIPEPRTLVGIATVTGLFAVSRRRRVSTNS
ncbi:exosortase-dependent surface protein XDP2 [Microcoleus sp. FACHB-68]|uniref:exosortase-dependent surface protein XDP2 n=1 Tax=Microcoleus sp. FACHB-68 TaxID=2692826 RepID=UPI001682961A|nr:exosortase-dependent surface protein XDP2 [Microcoleus sp. FACHB-68]MBD1939373.1 PEP-CTERM sorting domain-containing protein [Microcoleus sp. FACHB-68]